METEFNQIGWPVERILRNPDIILAIANRLGFPHWEAMFEAFYLLLENELFEASRQVYEGEVIINDEDEMREQFIWSSEEVMFTYFFEENTLQVLGDSGMMIQMQEGTSPVIGRGEKRKSGIRNPEDFQISSTLYQGFIEQIEKEVPELKGDIVLCDPPVPSNNFLRDEETDMFIGFFHLISNPEKIYRFEITVDTDELESETVVTEVSKDSE